MKNENKAAVVASLAETLKLTREGVLSLELSEDEKLVTIRFEGGGYRNVNVHADSEIAIIRDVCKHIG